MTIYPLRIGISGKICSGKTSLAEHLVQKQGFQRLTFARILKELCSTICAYRLDPNGQHHNLTDVARRICEANGLPVLPFLRQCLKTMRRFDTVSYVYDVNHLTEIKTEGSRKLLQHVGNGYREKFGDRIWINTTTNSLDPVVNYVADDARYENEYLELQALGFAMVRLNVSRQVQVERLAQRGIVYKTADFEHITETALDHYDFDYYIDADRPLAECLGELDSYTKDQLAHRQEWERMTNLYEVNDPRRSFELAEHSRKLAAARVRHHDPSRYRHHDGKDYLA
jgi:hypothetical protein